MNSVSWFIYAAQVCGSIGVLFTTFGTLALILTGAVWFFPRLFAAMNSMSYGDFKKEMKDSPLKPLRKGWLALAFTLILLGNLIPEKNTMYAIAVAQVGEQVVKSGATQEMASDATKALQQWIKRQIEPEKSEKK